MVNLTITKAGHHAVRGMTSTQMDTPPQAHNHLTTSPTPTTAAISGLPSRVVGTVLELPSRRSRRVVGARKNGRGGVGDHGSTHVVPRRCEQNLCPSIKPDSAHNHKCKPTLARTPFPMHRRRQGCSVVTGVDGGGARQQKQTLTQSRHHTGAGRVIYH